MVADLVRDLLWGLFAIQGMSPYRPAIAERAPVHFSQLRFLSELRKRNGYNGRSLVSVVKRMVRDQRMKQGGALSLYGGMDLLSKGALKRSRRSRTEQPAVAHLTTPDGFDTRPVERDRFVMQHLDVRAGQAEVYSLILWQAS